MTRPAIDSRQYIVALELRSTDDCPPDFELPATLAGFDTGLFLPRDDPDWFGRSAYPPRILLLKGGALHIVTHPSAGEPAHRWTLERISSVESGHMLLRGWLRFTGSGFDFTLRYNTRGFPSVFQFMRRFRSEFLHGTPCGDPAVNPRTALDIKFGNALERELDSAETVVTQAFQAPLEIRGRSWLFPRRRKRGFQSRYGTIASYAPLDVVSGVALTSSGGARIIRVDLKGGAAWQIPISFECQRVAEEFAGALEIQKRRNEGNQAAGAGALNAKAKNAAKPRKTNATR
jgi:hypothetical protein